MTRRDARKGTGLVPALLWLALLPAPGVALQETEETAPTCELVRVGGYTHRTRLDSTRFVHHATGGIDYRCSDGTRLLADSAVVFESNDQVQLFGRVFLEDSTTELRADSAHYFGQVRRLNAWSRVIVTDRGSGAVIRGHRLTYDQASEFRALDRIFVHEGEPRATIYPVVQAEAIGGDLPADEETAPAPEDESGEGEGEEIVPDSLTDEATGPGIDPSTDAGAGPEADSMAMAEAEADSMAAAEELSDLAERNEADSLAIDTAQATVPATDAESPPAAVVEAAPDTVPPADPIPAPPPDTLPPWEIEADHFTLEGRRHFRAGGNVVVMRDSLHAFGDSLDYDQESGGMSVFEGARVENANYLLRGESISLIPQTGLRETLLARGDATLTGDDVLIAAPAIRIFLEKGVVERLVALAEPPPLPGQEQEFDPSGLSPGDLARALAARRQPSAAADDTATDSLANRPVVSADRFNLSGDSIDVLSPGQRLQLVTAVGSARAEEIPADTLAYEELPEVAWRDWMEGDTVLAHFAAPDSLAPAPAAGPSARLETLTAAGTARSLYRMIEADSARADTSAGEPAPAEVESPPPATSPHVRPPALHWVEGQRIIVYLVGRQVVRMDVEGQTVGYHLEPRPPGEVPDSASLRADSTANPPLPTRPPPAGTDPPR